MLTPLEVELISLTARLEKAQKFSMNTAMHIEGMLLEAQIEALTDELKKRQDVHLNKSAPIHPNLDKRPPRP